MNGFRCSFVGNGQPSVSEPQKPAEDAISPEPDDVPVIEPDREVEPEQGTDDEADDPNATQADTDETINTPAEVHAVLGDRQMNSDVPSVRF